MAATLDPTFSEPHVSTNGPSEEYIFKVIAHPTGHQIVTIASDDTLSSYDHPSASNTKLELSKRVFKVHSGVTCLEVCPSDPDLLFTAGRDGLVKFHDWRLQAQNLQLQEPEKRAILSLAVNENFIACGSEADGRYSGITIWDRRNHRMLQRYDEEHTDDITQLQFHPHNPSTLLAGDFAGLLNLYNTSLPPSDENDTYLLFTASHPSGGIHRAGFLYPTPSSAQTLLYGVSDDHILAVYDAGDADPEGKMAKWDLRTEVGCDYVVDVVVAAADETGGEAQVVTGWNGSSFEENPSTKPAYLSLTPLTRSLTLNHASTTQLPYPWSHEIVRSLTVADASIISGGEDGYLRGWARGVKPGKAASEGVAAAGKKRGFLDARGGGRISDGDDGDDVDGKKVRKR